MPVRWNDVLAVLKRRRVADKYGFDAHDSDTLEELETLIDSIDLLLYVNDEV